MHAAFSTYDRRADPYTRLPIDTQEAITAINNNEHVSTRAQALSHL